MYEISFVFFTGLVAGLIGLAIGAGLYKNMGSSAARIRALTEALEKAESKNQAYQQQVAGHFSETAGLLNDLTRKYKDIHDHLAKGADQLCRDEKGQSLLIAAPAELRIEGHSDSASDSTEQAPQPPLDYAPKTKTTNTNTLAEDYGLEKINLHDQATDYRDPDVDAANDQLSDNDNNRNAPAF